MNTESLTKDMPKVVTDAIAEIEARFNEIEARFNEIVETGKARFEPIADSVESRFTARTEPVREQLLAGIKSVRTQAETNTSKLTEMLPALDTTTIPTPEQLAERYFAGAEQVLGWQRKMTLEAIANGRNFAEKAGVVDAPKPAAKKTAAKKTTARKPATKKAVATKKATKATKKTTARKPATKKSA